MAITEGAAALPDDGTRFAWGLFDGTNFYFPRLDNTAVGRRAMRVALWDPAGNPLAYAEDVAHTTGDYGIMALAVRQDTAAALAGTTGDYTPLIVDANGRLYVRVDDGQDAALGAIADAVVAAGATGSVSAKLRRATQGLEDLKSLIVLAAGSNNIGDVDILTIAAGANVIGKVGIDQTTPGTTNLVDTELPAAAALADNVANPTTAMIGAGAMQWDDNGAVWERRRGNQRATAFASAARTADVTTAAIFNYNAVGIMLYLDVTSVTATPTVQVLVYMNDPVTGNYREIATFTAVSPVGATARVYGLAPGGGTDLATYVEWKSGRLPRSFRIAVIHSDTDSITYSLGYSLIV